MNIILETVKIILLKKACYVNQRFTLPETFNKGKVNTQCCTVTHNDVTECTVHVIYIDTQFL